MATLTENTWACISTIQSIRQPHLSGIPFTSACQTIQTKPPLESQELGVCWQLAAV